jgi:hypothetical protein
MIHVRTRLLLPLLALCTVSCASITSGRYETLAVTSSPAGADANLVCDRHSAAAVTPAKIAIRRNVGDCVLTIAKADFEPAVLKIEQGVNPMYWGNMLLTPVPPSGLYLLALGNSEEKAIGVGLLAAGAVIFGTDFYTGAAHVHRPGVVDVVLKPKPR